MRTAILLILLNFTFSAQAQEERDTLLKRCPIYIVDTVTSNNFFIEARPATLKVYRNKGNLTIVVEQKDQFFTIFFNDKRLNAGTYKIKVNARKDNEVAAKYSFRTEDNVSYVNVSNGVVDVSFDEQKQHWRVKVNGLIANSVGRSVSYYKAKGDLFVK